MSDLNGSSCPIPAITLAACGRLSWVDSCHALSSIARVQMKTLVDSSLLLAPLGRDLRWIVAGLLGLAAHAAATVISPVDRQGRIILHQPYNFIDLCRNFSFFSDRFAGGRCSMLRPKTAVLALVPLLLGSSASTTPPQVYLWYGNYQTFGAIGVPQQWVNILGNVASSVEIATLTYSVNGAPEVNLNWGPTNPRLVEPGDFNADIDYSFLWPGSNKVIITATDYLNQSTQQTVYINNRDRHLSSDVGDFTIDFRKVTNLTLQNWVQIVDGVWDIGLDRRIRNTQMGYDRAFVIGDTNISGSYDVTTEFVLHGYGNQGWAFGAASGWLGHTLDNYGHPAPSQPYIGHPFRPGALSVPNLPPLTRI